MASQLRGDGEQRSTDYPKHLLANILLTTIAVRKTYHIIQCATIVFYLPFSEPIKVVVNVGRKL